VRSFGQFLSFERFVTGYRVMAVVVWSQAAAHTAFRKWTHSTQSLPSLQFWSSIHCQMCDTVAHSPMTLTSNANIGWLCTGAQCDLGRGSRLAMRFLASDLSATDYTFSDLEQLSNQFANTLTHLEIGKGDVFFTFLPKTPEQFVAFLGGLKAGAIVGTLFANFGPDALVDRLGDSRAKCIITRKGLLKRVLAARPRLPALQHIVVVDSDSSGDGVVHSYRELMSRASDRFDAVDVQAQTASVLHYTSGSTGKPKGVLHAHGSVAHQMATARAVLGIRDDDIFWCTADQGWVTGTSYGIIGPWSLGVTQIHYMGAFDARLWMTILEREKISVWYTAPTALRMLMREPEALFKEFSYDRLRSILSVGEPLNPEVIRWGQTTFERTIYDTWFQTETGGIMISNRQGLETRPGSMGTSVAGVEAAILDDSGAAVKDGETGHLCLKAGWPSMFLTYLNNDSAYRSKFRNGWYQTGDTAYRDADGYYWFMGRSDDVINTAGHLVSPFEVESALLEIHEVAESGVVAIPDELLFEKVVAFICLRDTVTWSADLELKIRLHVANRVSSVATPQEIVVVDSIPKNKSGKIMRRVLKARHLGLDAGDISTMET
jgi:acetyl-CoA synthetase